MIGTHFGYIVKYVDFSVVLDILIDLLFNLSTRNCRRPFQSRIVSSRLPSFECFHPFMNFCLVHATVDMPSLTLPQISLVLTVFAHKKWITLRCVS